MQRGAKLKNRKTQIFLIVAVILIVVLSFKYLELRKNNNALESQVKYEIKNHLSSSLSYESKIDLNKITTGDKNSILNMMHMYEEISDLNAILTTTYYGKITLINPLIMNDYKRVLRRIVDKSMQSQLKSEDINNVILITKDLKQIYKYIDENNKLTSKKFVKELEPKLNNLKIQQNN